MDLGAEMLRIHRFATSCILALCVSISLGVAWPAKSWASSVYVFTFTELSGSVAAGGSFSVPVSVFSSAVADTTFGIPTSDISGVALTEDGQNFGLSDVVAGDTVNFSMNASDVPQVYYATGAYPYIIAATPDGCATTNTCSYGMGPGNVGLLDVITPLGLTQVGGIWTTTVTPLPSTWTMLIAGFLGLSFLAYRGSKKSSAALASA